MNKKGSTKLFLGVFLLAFWLFFPMVMSFMGFYSSPSLKYITEAQKTDSQDLSDPLIVGKVLMYYVEIIFSIWIPEMGVFGNLLKIVAQAMTVLVVYLFIRGD